MRFIPLSLLATLACPLLPARRPEAPLTEKYSPWGGAAGCIAVAAAAKKIYEDVEKGRVRLYERLGRQPVYTLK